MHQILPNSLSKWKDSLSNQSRRAVLRTSRAKKSARPDRGVLMRMSIFRSPRGPSMLTPAPFSKSAGARGLRIVGGWGGGETTFCAALDKGERDGPAA